MGSIHGILFLMFVYSLVSLKPWVKINVKLMFKMFLLALFPFGFIVIDRHARKLIESERDSKR